MSLCGFACCHCGRCGGDDKRKFFNIEKIAGLCDECGTFNGPRDTVCKQCGAELTSTKTIGHRPDIHMANPSMLRKDLWE